MPATSADNSILATGRPARIPTPDDPSGFPNYYRNFRLTTLAGDSSATCVRFDATRMLREGRAILSIDLNAEIAHRALDLLVAQQKLYCSRVAGPAVSKGGFSSAQRVRPEDAPVKPDGSNPLGDQPRILASGYGSIAFP